MTDKTILVIDDSATIRKLVDTHLSPAGYRVVLAPNAEDGLKLAAEVRPDLILLDHQLPGTTGYEVCCKLVEVARVATDSRGGQLDPSQEGVRRVHRLGQRGRHVAQAIYRRIAAHDRRQRARNRRDDRFLTISRDRGSRGDRPARRGGACRLICLLRTA